MLFISAQFNLRTGKKCVRAANGECQDCCQTIKWFKKMLCTQPYQKFFQKSDSHIHMFRADTTQGAICEKQIWRKAK